MTHINATQTGYASMSEAELSQAERAIARAYLGRVPWEMAAWAFINLAVWLSLWPLVLSDMLPLWAAFVIACINVSMSYLPSHEAQHQIFARPGEKLFWLNELVGHLSVVPLATSYRALRETHLEHHKHTNDPMKDPDYSVTARNGLHHLWVGIKNRQPGAKGGLNRYADVLMELGTPEAKLALRDSLIWTLFFFFFLFGMAMSGHALEAALIWWLPRQFALSYIQYFLSWAPHHPGHETGRYRDTRAFSSMLGHIGTMGMTVHIVHHLHPRIPLTDTPAAYRALLPILEARNCELDGQTG